MVCRVGWLSADEMPHLRPGSIICAFHHLAVAPREKVTRFIELETTLLGYELVKDDDGERAILLPMSEMAGKMAVHVAAGRLQNEAGGRGILLGSVAGVPPPTVLILGAGTVGRTAARQALHMGAHVIVVDTDLAKLRRVNDELAGAAVTAIAGQTRLAKYTAFANVIIGAVLIPGSRAPFLVTEEMVKAMKPGSVILDLSIDQGGCVETSRPTTPDQPTFVAHDVIHYCVPNMTANIARTASRALANSALPILLRLAEHGLDESIRWSPGLSEGLYLYRGKVVNRATAAALDLEYTALEAVLPQESAT
jgi:alanine dehydrogenase